MKNSLTVDLAAKARETFGIFYVKAVVYLAPRVEIAKKQNKSNYKLTQIINHPWSISAFVELQESQTYCSRALNNKLSSVI